MTQYPSAMDCNEFLQRYSDFRDGRVTEPTTRAHMARHVQECRTCMRYDAQVSRGVTLLRSLSDLEPSPGFRDALQRRLAMSEAVAAEPFIPAHAAVMVALMLVTAVAAAWWELSNRAQTPIAVPTAREQPLPAIVASPGLPFVSFSSPGVSATAAEWRSPTAAAPFVMQVAQPR